jgi:hypothetical protein
MNELIENIMKIIAHRIDTDNIDPLENINLDFAKSLTTFDIYDLNERQLNEVLVTICD